MSDHDTPHKEPLSAHASGSHDKPTAPDLHTPEGREQNRLAMEKKRKEEEAAFRRMERDAKGKPSDAVRIRRDQERARAEAETLANAKESPILSASLFLAGSAIGAGADALKSFGKNADNALADTEKWADKWMKKYLHPSVYWMFGYKPAESAIEKEHKEHKKAEAKAKWQEGEDKFRKKLESQGMSEQQIEIKMLEREDKYLEKMKEKEEKEKEKHGDHGGHDDHGGGHKKKDDHGGHGKKDDHGHGGGGGHH